MPVCVTHLYILLYLPVPTPMHIHIHICKFVNVYINTYIHIYIHTYIHIHTWALGVAVSCNDGAWLNQKPTPKSLSPKAANSQS